MTSKSIILAVIGFVMISVLQAQPGEFKYAYSGSGANYRHFYVDSTGNNYYTASFNREFMYRDDSIKGNQNSEGEFLVLKTNPGGETIYLHSIKDENGTGYVNVSKAAVNKNGELFVAFKPQGISNLAIGNKVVTIDPAQESSVIAKFSKTGYLEWTKAMYAQGNSAAIIIKDLELDEQGNVYAAGDFRGMNLNLDGANVAGIDTLEKIFLVKYLPDGTTEWGATCGHSNDPVGNIFVNDIKISPDGTVYMSGITNGGKTFIFNQDNITNQGNRNTFLAAFDTQGNASWALPFQGDNTILPGSISLDHEGNIGFSCFFQTTSMVVDGTPYSSPNDYDVLINYIKPDKTFNWVDALLTNMSYISEGDYYFKHRFGVDSNLYVIGMQEATTNFVYMFTYTKEGVNTLIQQSTSGNAKYDDLYIDKEGNYTMAGNVYGTFDLGDSVITDATGYGTAYIAAITNTGDVTYVYQQPNDIDGSIYINGLGKDMYDNLYMAGNFYGADTYLGNHFLSAKYTSGIYLSQYGYIGSISGKVQDLYASAIGSGVVTLIGYTQFQRSPMLDTVPVNGDGAFKFDSVALGKYLILFIPDNSNGGTFLETYFPTTGSWEQGAHVIVDKENLHHGNLYINVPEMQTLDGQGKLSGEVTEIEEDDVFKGVSARPKSKSRASLAKSRQKSELQIIAETYTDDDGNFTFDNVPDGEYTILIDLPGLPNVSPHQVLVSGGNFLSNINYYVDEETVTGIGSPSGTETIVADKNNIVLVYPNPNAGTFKVASTTGKQIERVTIYNIQGKEIKQYINVQAKLTVNNLESGIYIVDAISEGESYKFKLIVNR